MDNTGLAPAEIYGRDVSRRRIATFAWILPATVAAVLFAQSVKEGLTLFEDDDEMEEVVAGQMISYGKHLYNDVFVSHGPLPYMITHAYAAIVSPTDFSYLRLSQAIAALMSCVALMSSACLRSWPGRICAGTTYLLVLSLAWNLEGFNILEYDTLGGFFFVIALAQFVLPPLLSEAPPRSSAFVGGAAVASAFFCAYSNIAAAMVFLLSAALSIRTIVPAKSLAAARCTKFAILGGLSALLLVTTWLLIYGDILGYLIYHFYFNQVVYSKYIDLSVADVFSKTFVFSFAPLALTHSLSLAFFVCWIGVFAAILRKSRAKSFPRLRLMSLGLLVCGVIGTNVLARPAYGDANFVNVNIALFSLSIALLLQSRVVVSSSQRLVGFGLLWLLAVVATAEACAAADFWFGAPQADRSKYRFAMKPADDAVYRVVRSITKQDGDLLSLIFRQATYVKAGRLPASKNLYYLPWQADYDKNPFPGYKMEICSDIRIRKPAVIWFFNWRVWDLYSMDEYEPCVLSLLVAGYKPLSFDSPWYIRSDLFQRAIERLPTGAVTQLDFGPTVPDVMQLSAPLDPSSPIELLMSPSHARHEVPLRRIGVMFGSHIGRNTGVAEISLRGSGNADFSQRFRLEDLVSNQYSYFYLDPKVYAVGQIRSLSGGGTSVWESHFGDSPPTTYTCMIYEYIDGTRRYTPACPVM
jgi:hypothetical protein